MTKVFIHVGSHKTGTTGLQYTLHAGREQLAAAGIFYPDISSFFGGDPARQGAKAHFAFATAIATPTPRSPRLLARFRAAIDAAAAQGMTTIISAESMYRHILAPVPTQPMPRAEEYDARIRYIAALAAFFEGLDAEFVCYFRRPDSFAESMYAEGVVNSPGRQSFARFLGNRAFRFEYGFQIETLSRHLPLRAHVFETAAAEGLMGHFFAALGLPLPDLPLASVTRARIPTAAVLWLQRAKATDPAMSEQERKRRWLFALQGDTATLFQDGIEASFWNSVAERDAFNTQALEGVTLAFPPPPPEVAPLPTWDDAQHAEAEARFATWQILQAETLAQREARLQEPFDAPELASP